MGYTHYWSYYPAWSNEQYRQLIGDADKIIQAVRAKGIILCGGLGEGLPEVSEETGIWFNGNGKEELDHETFIFPMDEELAARAISIHGYLWDCTKTARKPYDLAVCSILLVLKYHLGELIKIGSDGDRSESEWLPAERLVSEVLGYNMQYKEEDSTDVPEHWKGKVVASQPIAPSGRKGPGRPDFIIAFGSE